MTPLALATLAAAGADIAVQLARPGTFWPHAALKPLATLLIIAHAAGRGQPGDARRRALLAGLGLSLAGDVALLWPEQGFLAGLVSFLLAHLAYLWAFTRGVRLAATPALFAGYAVVAGGVLSVLWPGVPAPLRVPVLAYVVCLAGMAAQAGCFGRWLAGQGQPALGRSAALGGALFLASDACLALNKFLQPLPASALLILATYWAAQWCIASSLPARSAATSAQVIS